MLYVIHERSSADAASSYLDHVGLEICWVPASGVDDAWRSKGARPHRVRAAAMLIPRDCRRSALISQRPLPRDGVRSCHPRSVLRPRTHSKGFFPPIYLRSPDHDSVHELNARCASHVPRSPRRRRGVFPLIDAPRTALLDQPHPVANRDDPKRPQQLQWDPGDFDQ